MSATAILRAEHQTILRTLACVEALVTDAAYATEPVATLREVVDFLRTYADRLHHGKEEALLFPAMEARGISADAGPTAAMRYEHELGRALARRMATLAEADDAHFDRQAFREPALQFVALLRSHIAKEDQILFPMADRMLGGSDAGQLERAYANVEQRDFDADVHQRYESWALSLAHRLQIFDERFDVSPGCHA